MKYLMIAAMVLALSLCALAEEANFSLDRCTILNNAEDSTAPSKIALAFTLPDSLLDKDIIYAELSGWLELHNDGPDSLVELYFMPLMADWPDGQYDYTGIEAITDSLGAGNYTFRLSDSSAFDVDITRFIMDVSDSVRVNYGLIGTVDLLGESNIRLSEALGEQLQNSVRVKVTYK